MEEQTQQDPFNAFVSEIGTRLNEIEEKQRLIKDRILLVGENLISTKENYEKDYSEFKKQIKNIEFEIKSLKQLNKRIINELDNFARKSELEILQRQTQIFQPLKFARIEDVQKIVKKEIEKIQPKKLKNKES